MLERAMPFVDFSALGHKNSENQFLLGHWQRLAANPCQPDPVCSAPIWNLAYHEIFNRDRRIYYLASSSSLVLFSELHQPYGGIILTPLEDSWMFGRPLLGPQSVELLGEALAAFHREYAGQEFSLILSGIVEQKPETTKLLLLHGDRFNFYRYQKTTQCFALLADGFDGWLSRRSANHRAKLKKAARKAHNAGITFERVKPSTADEAADAYARMIAVELQSWKGIGKCGMAESPSREFYSALLRRHALENSCYVIFARVEDRDIGFIFGGTNGRFYRGQQFSYVRDYAHLSVGNLMQMEKVRWLCERGVERYDMGPITGPRMGYKAHWTEGSVVSQTWVMRMR